MESPGWSPGWLSTSLLLSPRSTLTSGPGPVAIVCQSGAIGAATFTLAQRAGLDAGLLINTGNEADLGFEEILERLCEPDAGTRVVLAYIEGLKDATDSHMAARRAAEHGISFGVIKVGTTEVGAAAAGRAYGKACRQ